MVQTVSPVKSPILVQKYGGSSVATPSSILKVANLIKSRRSEGNRICVVISAMGKTTDQLLATATEISQNPSRRELDMLLSCGERASMALLAMALQELQVPSISFTGSQSGIITDDVHSGAKIIEVRPTRLLQELELDKVVIVAGFQGVSYKKEITTLGRGGSDTTAIALTAALGATACEIYSDVSGVFTADPQIVSNAKPIAEISFTEMEELAISGAKVLNQEAVSFAKQKNITIFARKTGDHQNETVVKDITVVKPAPVTAIAHQLSLLKISISNYIDLENTLQILSQNNIIPCEIISINPNSIWCFILLENAHGVANIMANNKNIALDNHFGTVTLIGNAHSNQSDTFLNAIRILKQANIQIEGTTTNQLKTSFIIKKEHIKPAVKLLHDHFITSNKAHN